MNDQDAPRFAILLIGIGETYGKSFNSETIDIYWYVLKEFKFEEVQKAFYRHLGNPDVGRYLPKPADIIMAMDGTSHNQSLHAWTKVISAIQRPGSYSSVVFDDVLIHAVIEDMSGWQKLCLTKDEQLPFVGKEFQERYRGYVVKKPIRHPKYFIGITERQNSLCGYGYDPPVLIGDVEKAKQVYVTGSRASLGDETYFLENLSRSLIKIG